MDAPGVSVSIGDTSSLDHCEIVSRDSLVRREEEQGEVKFHIIINDGDPIKLRILLELKNIFRKQLPQMPKEYIVRLVFDRNHKSVAAIKQGRVIGGITYRPFKEHKFGEIAFCAVSTTEQVRGYGTRLMNHLKEFCKRPEENIEFFLTYADNFAIVFFKKQGFKMPVTMPRERWAPFIKDYEGGTLMECYINPRIEYLSTSAMIARQRYAIEQKVSQLTTNAKVWAGLPWEEGQAAYALDAIPGIKEAGWSCETIQRPVYRTRGEVENVADDVRGKLVEALANIKKSKHAWPFEQPVDTSVVTDYLAVVTDPIDLATIDARLQAGFYRTKDIFCADLRRMCDNCRKYNPKDSVYFQCADAIEKVFTAELKRLHVFPGA